jgi:glycosyltransferase involved in cell wall biosynthesis
MEYYHDETDTRSKPNTSNIGFVSFRFSGTDGVSLETEKWAHILEKHGHTCYYFAGESDRPDNRTMLVAHAHFQHPDIEDITDRCFGVNRRDPEVTERIFTLKNTLKKALFDFLGSFRIDVLIAENSLSLPLNIPLAMALTEIISEMRFPTIAHHHDFFWERKRFMVNCVWDYLDMCYPPQLPTIHHVVINSDAASQLCMRGGISSAVIPNVMDFDHPYTPSDTYAADVRHTLGVADDEYLILQPTRVVLRKGIERAIELVSRLDMKTKLVISHASGDEGYDYEKRVRQYARLLDVNVLFEHEVIKEKRGSTPDGRKIYSLYDVYPYADLVTFPSDIEGFGNALLESIYFYKPVVVNHYLVYLTDIKPKGFRMVEIPGYVTDEAVAQTQKILQKPQLRERMVVGNYELAKRYFSFPFLERKLLTLLVDCMGV